MSEQQGGPLLAAHDTHSIDLQFLCHLGAFSKGAHSTLGQRAPLR